MLQEIRERAQGWIAWFIVILISVPFALWGISSYLDGGSAPVVASVNGQDITEREFDNSYRQFRQRLRDQLGQSYRPELIDDERMRDEFLQRLIRERLVLQASDQMGLSAGDTLVRAYINQLPVFQVDGRFNNDAYERTLRNQGMSPVGFEAQVRQSLMSDQLLNGVSGTEFATRAEVDDLARLQLQRRGLKYVVLEAEAFHDQVEISDAQVRSHYDENRDSYMAPERVKLEYIDLDIENISQTLSADEASLLGFYESNKADYATEERRRASHILISSDEQNALEKAQQALARVRDGEDFAVVAKELSQDPGSADLGGDLGFFSKGIMEPAFEDAVFAMSIGDVSEPVKTEFGYHVIKLVGIEAAQRKGYEEVKDQIRSAYLKREAERLFYEYAERLSDLAYEDPTSLAPAADALGIETKISDWLAQTGGKGLFASSKVIGAAFSEDVLNGRNNSEPIEIGAEHIIVLRVAEHEVAAVRPLEEIHETIRTELTTKAAALLAEERGREILAALSDSSDFDAVAADAGLKLIAIDEVERNTTGVPLEIRNTLFKLPRPLEGRNSYGEAKLAGGDFALIAVTGVRDGSAENLSELGDAATVRSTLERSRGQSYYSHLIDNLRERAKVTITQRKG
ncbi:MAG: SurA N-terminal domain-containing protein [Gammaproteobacteria bacterium]|nr:SurA N-terminal domain-containing protein [Gammaproteobacteria bacterium]